MQQNSSGNFFISQYFIISAKTHKRIHPHSWLSHKRLKPVKSRQYINFLSGGGLVSTAIKSSKPDIFTNYGNALTRADLISTLENVLADRVNGSVAMPLRGRTSFLHDRIASILIVLEMWQCPYAGGPHFYC